MKSGRRGDLGRGRYLCLAEIASPRLHPDCIGIASGLAMTGV
jgi:hypothetical protein